MNILTLVKILIGPFVVSIHFIGKDYPSLNQIRENVKGEHAERALSLLNDITEDDLPMTKGIVSIHGKGCLCIQQLNYVQL